MAYVYKKVNQTIERLWESARSTIERMFIRIDAEFKKIKAETDRFHPLSSIVHCEVNDDFDQVFDDDGNLVTID